MSSILEEEKVFPWASNDKSIKIHLMTDEHIHTRVLLKISICFIFFYIL